MVNEIEAKRTKPAKSPLVARDIVANRIIQLLSLV